MSTGPRLVVIEGEVEDDIQPDMFDPPLRISVYEGYEQVAAFDAEPHLDRGAIEWIRTHNWKKESA